MSLSFQWQDRLVSWLASRVNSLGPKHRFQCILTGIKTWCFQQSSVNSTNDFLNLRQCRETTDLPSSAAVKPRKSGLSSSEGHVLTKHSLARVPLADSSRQDDLTLSYALEGCGCVNRSPRVHTDLGRQTPVLWILKEGTEGKLLLARSCPSGSRRSSRREADLVVCARPVGSVLVSKAQNASSEDTKAVGRGNVFH